MASVISGLLGGLLGAIAAGGLMAATSDDPGPAAVVWAKFLGDGVPTNYEAHGLGVHLVYGALAGAAFVLLAGALSLGISTLVGAFLWALVWSAVLVVVAAGFWMRLVVGDAPDTDAISTMAITHVVFGVALGLVVYLVPRL